MEDIVKVTRGLITNIFKKVRTALNAKADKSDLNKKADKEDVVLIENIGEAGMVAPLDTTSKVPRENINENGIGILEVEDFVNGVTYENSSTTVWDYIVYDTSIKRFLAYNNGSYYSNWSNSEDYRDSITLETREDRIFVNTKDLYFFRWIAVEDKFVEVCNSTDTIEATITADQKKILLAMLKERNIKIASTLSAANNIKTKMYHRDIVYVQDDDKYYYLDNTTLTELKLSDLTYKNTILKFPTQLNNITTITSNPFNDVESMISQIYKGETVGSYTKWYLVMKVDSEDQTYTAGRSSSANYYKQSYTCYSSGFNKPWELWLPNTVSWKSVYIDW